MSVTGQMIDEAEALAEEHRQALESERIAHVVTRQELIETRELLRQAAACVPDWGFPYKALPYKALRQRIEAVLAAPVPPLIIPVPPHVVEAYRNLPPSGEGRALTSAELDHLEETGEPPAWLDSSWAKPPEQPATGPLRRKLGIARGVLITVLDSTTIGGPPMPTPEELRQAIDETADP